MKIFKSFAIATLLLASLGVAQAVETSKTYVSQNGIPFSLEKVRKVESAAGAVTLTFENGESSYSYLADSGAVFAKIKANNPAWLVSGNAIYNPAKAKYITCSSNSTTLGWYAAGAESFADGCALYQQAVTKSN